MQDDLYPAAEPASRPWRHPRSALLVAPALPMGPALRPYLRDDYPFLMRLIEALTDQVL